LRKDSPDPEGTAENIRIGAIGTAPQAIADRGLWSETRRAQTYVDVSLTVVKIVVTVRASASIQLQSAAVPIFAKS
jgi:hypothetical protein